MSLWFGEVFAKIILVTLFVKKTSPATMDSICFLLFFSHFGHAISHKLIKRCILELYHMSSMYKDQKMHHPQFVSGSSLFPIHLYPHREVNPLLNHISVVKLIYFPISKQKFWSIVTPLVFTPKQVSRLVG